MREAREYVQAPTALRNRPLPYDAREEVQLEVAVTERERGLLQLPATTS